MSSEKRHVPSFHLNIQELRDSARVYVLTVRWFTSIKDIKDMIHRITRQPPRCLDLFYGTNARVLTNNMTLHDFGIEKSGHTLRLAINSPSASSRGLGGTMKASFVLSPSRDVGMDAACRRMVQDVTAGLQNGLAPSRTDVLDCTGGVYFMKNIAKRKVAVFKPHDEEQGMPNNDKGYGGNGEHSLRPNFKPGQGCIREVAAYIMDVENFTGVPPTTLVHCEHPNFNYSSHRTHGRSASQFPKLGSLQHFVESDGTYEDYGDNMFSDFEIQKLALFDIRALNCDRNASNILLQRKRKGRSGSIDDTMLPQDGNGNGNGNGNGGGISGRRGSRSASLSSWENGYYSSDDLFEYSRSDDEDGVSGITSRSGSFDVEKRASKPRKSDSTNKDRYLLIPIDHGYCCPSALDIKEWDWAWFHLPHVKKPVHPKIKAHLLSIDLNKLCQELEDRVSMSEESLFLIRLTHNLLVTGINAGLSLYDIAQLIARLDEDVPSPLERAIQVAEENALRAIEMRSGRLNSRGVPALRLEAGGRGTSAGRTLNSPTMLGTMSKDMASDDNLPASSQQSSPQNQIDRETEDLFNTVPLRRLGSNSSFGSNGSGGFGIGYVDDDGASDTASDMDTTATATATATAVGSGGDSATLHATFAGCRLSSREGLSLNMPSNSGNSGNSGPYMGGGGGRSPLPPRPPTTPTGGITALSPTSAGKVQAGSNSASYGIGVGISERFQPGAPLSRLETMQTPPVSMFKNWQHSAQLSPSGGLSPASCKGRKVIDSSSGGGANSTTSSTATAASLTPLPYNVSLAREDSHSRPQFTQSGRDWLKSAGSFSSPLTSPVAGTALQFDKFATHASKHDDDDGIVVSGGDDAEKQLTPLGTQSSDGENGGIASKLSSGFPSPTTDVGSSSCSSTFEFSASDLSGSNSQHSPRVRTKRNGSSSAKSSRRKSGEKDSAGTTGTSGGNEADVDTDMEGSSPSDSTNEDAAVMSTSKQQQQQHQQQKPPASGSSSSNSSSKKQSAAPSSPGLELPDPTKLMRVTSFSAFSNAPLYDMEEGERRYGRLYREKRRFQVSTAEFKSLRDHFTNDRVAILVGKARSGSLNE
jgi:hypothetical protein